MPSGWIILLDGDLYLPLDWHAWSTWTLPMKCEFPLAHVREAILVIKFWLPRDWGADACQHVYLALDNDLEILPVVAPRLTYQLRIRACAYKLRKSVDWCQWPVLTSATSVLVLKNTRTSREEKVPAPTGDISALKPWFSIVYDAYRGVILKFVSWTVVKPGDKIPAYEQWKDLWCDGGHYYSRRKRWSWFSCGLVMLVILRLLSKRFRPPVWVMPSDLASNPAAEPLNSESLWSLQVFIPVSQTSTMTFVKALEKVQLNDASLRLNQKYLRRLDLVSVVDSLDFSIWMLSRNVGAWVQYWPYHDSSVCYLSGVNQTDGE